jgi:hypothetical protein
VVVCGRLKIDDVDTWHFADEDEEVGIRGTRWGG